MRYLRTLDRAVEANADRPFLIAAADGREVTYAEAHERALGIAAALRERGIGRGERVAVSAANSVELALLYLGLLYGGFIVVPIGSGFGRRERRSILERSRPAAIVADDAEQLEALAALAAHPAQQVVLGPGDGGLDPWTADPGGFAPFDGTSSEDVVSIHFTSGTTGLPRGVGHRLRNFVGNAERVAEALALDGTHRFHSALPMTYMAGYYNLLLLPFTLGASVVIDRAFDAASLLRFWETPIRHGVDTLWFVPTMLAMLLKTDRDPRGPEYCRERVRLALSGTARLDPEVRARFEERYGVTVHDSYGLSETLLIAGSTPARPATEGAIGTVLPGVRLEPRGNEGPLPAGESGHLLVDTPDLMAGYLQDGDGGEPRFAVDLAEGRWFDTGDIGRITADGEVAITGRAKEIIIRGGINVSAVEVERALEQHPAVERAAVVGVPHEILGEEIAAVVVCRDGVALEAIEDELKEQVRGQLERAQQPGIYLQIDRLPLTPTGKIRKAAVRDLVVDRLGLPSAGKSFALEDAGGEAAAAGGFPAGRLIDLSHPIREGMTTFPSPNHPRVEVTVLARHPIEGRATRRLVLGTHTGTHVDAPLHFIPDGTTIGEIPLETLVGPAQVADLTPVEPLEEVSLDRLRQALGGELRRPRLLLRYGWSERFASLAFYEESPYLSLEACEWLVEQGVRLLGMDTPSPDDPRNGFGSGNDSPNHHVLLGAGVVLLEYLNGLDRIGSREIFLAALPLPVAGADGAPARVVAIEPS